MRSPRFLHQHLLAISLLLILTAIMVVVLGCLLLPSVFYDQWIWKYYWGPVVADARGHSVSLHGVSAVEGYTLVSELTYGVILVLAIIGIYKLLKKLDIPIDWGFCLALMPYILFGPVTRVLEDTEYYTEPTVFFFISPLIYLVTAGFVFFFMFTGLGASRLEQRHKPRIIILLLLGVFLAYSLGYTILYLLGLTGSVRPINPIVFLLTTLISFLPIAYAGSKQRLPKLTTIIFSGGLLILLPCVYLLADFIIQPWSPSYGIFLNVFGLVILIVTIVTTIVWSVGYTFRKTVLNAYRQPLNLAMLAGHTIDGVSSYISIANPLNMGIPAYSEKHPASNALLTIWPPLYPIIKVVLILLIIYLFDIAYREEMQRYTRLVNLLKIGIFILGVSPGLRDLLRVTLGV
jgi:uncharacterized membrane protein